MAYKTYSRSMVADFTGRPAASFPQTYVDNVAIPQAILLFKLATCIADPSGLSPDEQQLVDFAILAMADSIHLAAPYQAAMASPFNSESIGSYSYSKTAKAVQNGDETGVMWFDLAVRQLSQCDRAGGDFQRGGIEVFEHDGAFGSGRVSGNVDYLSPSDVDGAFLPSSAPDKRIPSLFESEEVPLSWVEDPPGSGLYVQEL